MMRLPKFLLTLALTSYLASPFLGAEEEITLEAPPTDLLMPIFFEDAEIDGEEELVLQNEPENTVFLGENLDLLPPVFSNSELAFPAAEQEELVQPVAPLFEAQIEAIAEELLLPAVTVPETELPKASNPLPFSLPQVKMETPAYPLEKVQRETRQAIHTIEINLKEVFEGAPIIYGVLFLLSISAFTLWIYQTITTRVSDFFPKKIMKEVRVKLVSHQFDQALELCDRENYFFCKMLASGILARKYGLTAMTDAMKAESKRVTTGFWQRLNLLNDIALIAPMLGLLGTVVGMFYAFYDLNRSMESVSSLFDGLGISVGTTVAGLCVAILAMVFHALSKYKLIRMLSRLEKEIQAFATLIDNNPPQILK